MARILFVSLFDEVCKGVRYLTASARRAGHEAGCLILKINADHNRPVEPCKDEGYYGELFHVSEAELQHSLDFIESYSPDILGLSVFSHYTGVAEWLTAKVRRKFPDLRIVWGGVDVMYNRDRAIQSADMICTGEGEEAIADLLDCLDKKADPARVAGFWTRRNGEILKQPDRPIPKSLDDLPLPAYDPDGFWVVRGGPAKPFQPEENPAYALPYILTTRGCPSSCTYCYPSAFRESFEGQRVVRFKSVGRVIEEIHELLKHYPFLPFLKFADDVFGLNRRWAAEFREAYTKNFSLPFRCYAHPTISRKPILEELKRAGLDVAVIGVQTASRRILQDVYNRPFYREDVLRKFEEFRELDIWPVFDLILFNPLEDESDLLATLNLLYDLPRPFGFPFLGVLMIFRNFPIYKIMLERNAKIRPLDNSNTFFAAQGVELNHLYHGIFGLAALEGFPKPVLEKIRASQFFRDDPDALVQMMRSVLRDECIFIDELWVPKTKLLRRMATEIQTLRGSLAHQTAERLRRAHRWIARQQQANRNSDLCPSVDRLPDRLLEQTHKRNLLAGSLMEWMEP